MPASRWKGDGYWSANKRRNTCIAKSGHFIKQDISRFDASFFGISSAEAAAMDPQHRLMTEVAFEALEAAGLTLDEIRGSRTGVWVGHFTSDYKEMLYRDPDGAPAYAATGLQKTSLANRLSWLWDLRGPSFTLDTACSSSLVALHVACQSLRLGECDMAIVGGSNLLLGPDVFNFFGGQGFLSPDGKSKSFDASADGYGRGEGFAAVVLKRADDAILHQDPIRAVIRGTACNQDGHTKGFTLPSSEAQIALIKSVYGLAGLDMDGTGYVEAHVCLSLRVSLAVFPPPTYIYIITSGIISNSHTYIGNWNSGRRPGRDARPVPDSGIVSLRSQQAAGRVRQVQHWPPGGRGRSGGRDQVGPGAREGHDPAQHPPQDAQPQDPL